MRENKGEKYLQRKYYFSPIRGKHGGAKQFKLAHQGERWRISEAGYKIKSGNNELCLKLVQFDSKCENLVDGNCKKYFL